MESKVIVDQTEEEGGFSVVYLWFKPHFPLFRHRHEVDCMYTVISGSAVLGNQTLRAGDCFFAGAQAPYGYVAGPEGVEVLEFRHGAQKFSTMFSTNQESRLEEARAVVEEHGELWQGMTVSPLYRANAEAGAPGSAD
jgi:hypothetical protein